MADTTTTYANTTTTYANTTTTYPITTHANILEIALAENDNKFKNIRYDIIDEQEKLNNIINRLNNLKFTINTLKSKNKYTATGDLSFY